MAASDEQLMQAIQGGGHEAFAELVTRHSQKFTHLAYRYLGQKEAAEDRVQAAFLTLWQQPHLWQAGKGVKFTTWFYRVIVNGCLDAHKKQTPAQFPEQFDMKDERANPEQEAIQNQQEAALMSAMDTLPDRQKTALILCAFEQMSHSAAAEIMDVGVKALESLLSRAKTTLREKLTPILKADDHEK